MKHEAKLSLTKKGADKLAEVYRKEMRQFRQAPIIALPEPAIEIVSTEPVQCPLDKVLKRNRSPVKDFNPFKPKKASKDAAVNMFKELNELDKPTAKRNLKK